MGNGLSAPSSSVPRIYSANVIFVLASSGNLLFKNRITINVDGRRDATPHAQSYTNYNFNNNTTSVFSIRLVVLIVGVDGAGE
jgi:hypothetical protein